VTRFLSFRISGATLIVAPLSTLYPLRRPLLKEPSQEGKVVMSIGPVPDLSGLVLLFSKIAACS